LDLKNQVDNFLILLGDTMNKKLLTIAIAGAMAAPMTAHAVKWKMSGQVNRAVIIADDGNKSDIKSVDNTSSNTRFRMRGSEDLGNGMKVGAYWELGINSNPASDFTPDGGDFGGDPVSIRQANVWFSGNWGKLTLGHTSEAADGTAGADLSGTGLATTGPGNSDTSGDMMFWNKRTNSYDGADEGDAYSKFDGGRNDTIRYDSPKLGPVGLAASVSSDSRWSAAAKVKTALGGGQLSAGLGYVHASYDQWTMSASYLFSQGTSIGGYYGTRDSTDDPNSWAVTLGHKWGVHAVAATYAEGNDLGTNGSEGMAIGVEYVHSLKKANTQLYIGYRHAEYDRSGASYEDHDHVAIGARVKFD
jgi:predicted porin